MRKFILFVMVTMFTFMGAYAQNDNERVFDTAIQKTSLLDNVFVGVQGGGTWALINHDSKFFDNVNVSGLFRVGKYLTPITGLQLSFEAGALEGGKCVVDHTNLMAGMITNWSNLLYGYSGVPRTFEVESEIAGGWFHGYGLPNAYNSASARASVYFNWNLGETKAWQLNLVPSWTYLPMKSIECSYVGLSVGVTYKFKNKSNKKRHFTLVNVISPSEWASINEDLNRLRSEKQRLSNEIANYDPVVVRDTVTVEVPSKAKLSNVISFNLNSSTVEPLQMANLSLIANALLNDSNLKVLVRGYADKETGTPEYNKELSFARANSVKNILVEKFKINEDRISIDGVGDGEQLFDENDWNRVAVFVVE